MKRKLFICLLIMCMLMMANSTAVAISSLPIDADESLVFETKPYEGLVINGNTLKEKVSGTNVKTEKLEINGIDTEIYKIEIVIESPLELKEKVLSVTTINGGTLTNNGDNIAYLEDANKERVATIGNLEAYDAKGMSIPVGMIVTEAGVSYSIAGENVNYPVTITSTVYPTQYYYEYLTAFNTYLEREKLIEARRTIDERQNSTVNTFIGLINSIFGLFNIYTGIASLAIGGAITAMNSFLESCENVYSYIIEEFDLKHYMNVRITYPYRGDWDEICGEYVYTALVPTYVFNVETAEG